MAGNQTNSRSFGGSPSYLRFVTEATAADSQVLQGVFQAAYGLRDAGRLDGHERIWFQETVGWLHDHLRAPSTHGFSRASHAWEFDRVVFWFRDTAHEHIQRMQEPAAMLRYHRIPVRMLRTARPGRVVYEDEHQAGAIPFREGTW